MVGCTRLHGFKFVQSKYSGHITNPDWLLSLETDRILVFDPIHSQNMSPCLFFILVVMDYILNYIHRELVNWTVDVLGITNHKVWLE